LRQPSRFELMPKAFVFANVEAGSETEVLKRLRDISEVKEAYCLYGVYDIVVRVETDSVERLKEVITSRVRGLDKIRSTLTTIAME
jgi:DNA-binding Lrp family transcriptional regulator